MLSVRIVMFGNDVSEHQRVSTIIHPVSIMMLGVVPLNGEMMPPVSFELSYRVTSAVYKEVLEMKILPWINKSTKNSDYVMQ